jgi:hypothetical protein
MQIQDFVKVYQANSDEELIQLAHAPQLLTSEARIALQGELSRRAITIADNSEAPNAMGMGTVRTAQPLVKDCRRVLDKMKVSVILWPRSFGPITAISGFSSLMFSALGSRAGGRSRCGALGERDGQNARHPAAVGSAAPVNSLGTARGR